jgi:hypothetical protein
MHEVEEIEVSHEGAPIVKVKKCRPWHFEADIHVIQEYLENKLTSLQRRGTP